MPCILLLAPHGQVGFELQRALAPLGVVTALSRAELDFTRLQALQSRVLALKPDVIINAAAYTAVDKAQQEQAEAFAINAALPEMLAKLAAATGAWLVHYSTDYVYPGHGNVPWLETDATGPLSVYGHSKLAGDLAIQANCERHFIFRTSWVYAARGHNFMLTMLRLAQQHSSLRVVNDQFGAPTPARCIAAVTALALQQALQGDNRCAGLYHLACRGETNWYDFATAIFQQAAQQQFALRLQPGQCQPIASTDYPTAAVRPANSRLNLTKLEQQFQLQLPDWRSQLALTLNEWLGTQPRARSA